MKDANAKLDTARAGRSAEGAQLVHEKPAPNGDSPEAIERRKNFNAKLKQLLPPKDRCPRCGEELKPGWIHGCGP